MATSVLAAIQFAQQYAQTDANGITSVLGLAWANDGLNDFHRELNVRRINASGLNFQPASVVSAGASVLTWPANNYALKTIEVSYGSPAQQNYYQAQEVEISNTQGVSFDQLRVNQTTERPLFANYGATWELFPTPQQDAYVKFVNFTIPTEYTDIGSAIGYPLTLDYRLLGVKIASAYKLMLGDYPSYQAFEAEYQKRVSKIIEILAPASQQPIQAETLKISGWQF